jgi:hypothetical protein
MLGKLETVAHVSLGATGKRRQDRATLGNLLCTTNVRWDELAQRRLTTNVPRAWIVCTSPARERAQGRARGVARQVPSTTAVDRDLVVERPRTADRVDEIDLRWFGRLPFLLRLPESAGGGSP